MRWLVGITNSLHMSWANSGRYQRTGKAGVLQSMQSQRVRHNWATEQQWPRGSDSPRDDLVSGLHVWGLGARLCSASLIYNVAFVSAVQQSESVYVYTYPVSFRFFSRVDHHRVLTRLSCAVWEVLLVVYFTYSCVYVGLFWCLIL